ncbi:hypothetical protein N0V90_000986 [Kalmusia sp. IMI 367209]|nr:hypothetical protein N0V90_000986 [Kalmusia sp. IMI 367209]
MSQSSRTHVTHTTATDTTATSDASAPNNASAPQLPNSSTEYLVDIYLPTTALINGYPGYNPSTGANPTLNRSGSNAPYFSGHSRKPHWGGGLPPRVFKPVLTDKYQNGNQKQPFQGSRSRSSSQQDAQSPPLTSSVCRKPNHRHQKEEYFRLSRLELRSELAIRNLKIPETNDEEERRNLEETLDYHDNLFANEFRTLRSKNTDYLWAVAFQARYITDTSASCSALYYAELIAEHRAHKAILKTYRYSSLNATSAENMNSSTSRRTTERPRSLRRHKNESRHTRCPTPANSWKSESPPAITAVGSTSLSGPIKGTGDQSLAGSKRKRPALNCGEGEIEEKKPIKKTNTEVTPKHEVLPSSLDGNPYLDPRRKRAAASKVATRTQQASASAGVAEGTKASREPSDDDDQDVVRPVRKRKAGCIEDYSNPPYSLDELKEKKPAVPKPKKRKTTSTRSPSASSEPSTKIGVAQPVTRRTRQNAPTANSALYQQDPPDTKGCESGYYDESKFIVEDDEEVSEPERTTKRKRSASDDDEQLRPKKQRLSRAQARASGLFMGI